MHDSDWLKSSACACHGRSSSATVTPPPFFFLIGKIRNTRRINSHLIAQLPIRLSPPKKLGGYKDRTTTGSVFLKAWPINGRPSRVTRESRWPRLRVTSTFDWVSSQTSGYQLIRLWRQRGLVVAQTQIWQVSNPFSVLSGMPCRLLRPARLQAV